MSVETLQVFFALLALAANAGTIAIAVAAVAGRGSSLRGAILGPVRGYELWLAALVATTSTVGSLYFSEVAHFIPCLLCWYQRIAMYPLAIILVIAALRRDHGIRMYAATLAFIGAAIAAYHRTIEIFPNLDSGSCAATGVPCTAPYFETFGFITLAYMALSGFLFVLALLWADRANSDSDAPSSRRQDDATTESA
jgi:disulfide bond formation protein DsbB